MPKTNKRYKNSKKIVGSGAGASTCKKPCKKSSSPKAVLPKSSLPKSSLPKAVLPKAALPNNDILNEIVLKPKRTPNEIKYDMFIITYFLPEQIITDIQQIYNNLNKLQPLFLKCSAIYDFIDKNLNKTYKTQNKLIFKTQDEIIFGENIVFNYLKKNNNFKDLIDNIQHYYEILINETNNFIIKYENHYNNNKTVKLCLSICNYLNYNSKNFTNSINSKFKDQDRSGRYFIYELYSEIDENSLIREEEMHIAEHSDMFYRRCREYESLFNLIYEESIQLLNVDKDLDKALNNKINSYFAYLDIEILNTKYKNSDSDSNEECSQKTCIVKKTFNEDIKNIYLINRNLFEKTKNIHEYTFNIIDILNGIINIFSYTYTDFKLHKTSHLKNLPTEMKSQISEYL